MAKMVKLQSSDGEIFNVPEKVARVSQTLVRMLDNPAFKDCGALPLPQVSGPILKKVIQWATYHKDEDTTNCAKAGEIDPWDTQFLNAQEGETLFGLIVAARILDIQLLLDLTCKTTAGILKGHNVQEIHKIFGIHRRDYV